MLFLFGGPEGIRTLGLCVANAALSRLSYGPKYKAQNQAHRVLRYKMQMLRFKYIIILKSIFFNPLYRPSQRKGWSPS